MKRYKITLLLACSLFLVGQLSGCGDSKPTIPFGSTFGFQIVDISPRSGETLISSQTDVTILFTEAVDERSLEDRFELIETCNGTVEIPGTFSYRDGGREAIFTPDGLTGLRTNCSYHVRVPSGVRSKFSGAELTNPETGHVFGTIVSGRPSIPGAPPTVSYLYPQPDTYWVGCVYGIELRFSEPVTEASVAANGILVREESFGLPGGHIQYQISVNPADTSLWYIEPINFPLGFYSLTDYIIIVNGVQDYDNEIMTAPYSGTYRFKAGCNAS